MGGFWQLLPSRPPTTTSSKGGAGAGGCIQCMSRILAGAGVDVTKLASGQASWGGGGGGGHHPLQQRMEVRLGNGPTHWVSWPLGSSPLSPSCHWHHEHPCHNLEIPLALVTHVFDSSCSPLWIMVVLMCPMLRVLGASVSSSTPPPFLYSNRPCIVTGGGGTVTFRFANLLRRLDVELLLCVCWLDQVVLLVHCCVTQICCIQGTPLCPVSCRTLQFFTISAMDVDHIDAHSPDAVVNFQRSGGYYTRGRGVAHVGQQTEL